MNDRKESIEVLERFAFNVIKFARANLTRQGKNASSTLYRSLDSEVEVGPNSFRLTILMEEYGLYQDQGVKGTKSSRRAPRSPYRFGTGTAPKGRFKPAIDRWITLRRIRGRDEQGRFITKKSLSFLIRRSIYEKGIRSSYFITKPFEAAFRHLPAEFIEAYALDIENLIDFVLKDHIQ